MKSGYLFDFCWNGEQGRVGTGFGWRENPPHLCVKTTLSKLGAIHRRLKASVRMFRFLDWGCVRTRRFARLRTQPKSLKGHKNTRRAFSGGPRAGAAAAGRNGAFGRQSAGVIQDLMCFCRCFVNKL